MAALTLALIAQFSAMPACSAPGMVPEFWPAVVKIESQRDPFALHDDTTHQSYYPASADLAEAIAVRLMSQGHSVGVGLSQLTAASERHFVARFGVTIRQALDPCTNMRVGAQFYVGMALSIYHTGSPVQGAAYAASVVRTLDASRPSPESRHATPLAVVLHDAVHVHPVRISPSRSEQ
jgi:type IV secretion system protein VirB1